MGYLQDRTVVLGVGGGIAVYRVCELARLLMKRGAKLRVAMTRNACEFVTPMTFQALTGNPVLTDLFEIQQEAKFGHLETGHAAELFIVAPATANLIARIQMGMADDAVTTSLVASTCPVLLAPAMNSAMWENRQVQQNMRALLADERFRVVGPAHGMLAEGVVGVGRLAEPPDIAEAAERLLAPRDLAGMRVVITAGPTREHLDPVRFLSNPSSGRMGYALARAAAMRGASVLLVSGPTELPVPEGVERVSVTSAEEMAAAALPAARGAQIFIAAAAVADQRPQTRAEQKVKKQPGEETLVLVRTPDILAQAVAAAGEPRPFFVGFAAETEHLLENAAEKMRRKGLDLMCANDVTQPGCGFASTRNMLTLIDRDGGLVEVPEGPKEDLAHAVLDRVRELGRGRRTAG